MVRMVQMVRMVRMTGVAAVGHRRGVTLLVLVGGGIGPRVESRFEVGL